MDPNRRPPLSPVGFALIGSQMAGFTVAGVAFDYLVGTLPWATVVLTLLGLAAAFAQLVRATQQGRPPAEGPR